VVEQGLATGDAGVVEDDVELAEHVDRTLHGGLDLAVDRDVDLHRGDGPRVARPLDLGDDLLRLLEVDVGDDDLRALADELLDGRQADAAGPTGDEGDLVLQAHDAAFR
jgi:hypothetical protein